MQEAWWRRIHIDREAMPPDEIMQKLLKETTQKREGEKTPPMAGHEETPSSTDIHGKTEKEIVVPVAEVTQYLTDLESAKIPGHELRKRITNLHYENQKLRQWANELLRRYEAAKSQGKPSIELPPLPDEARSLFSPETEKDDLSEREYIREIMRTIGPYILAGKVLSGEVNTERKEDQRAEYVEMTQPDGSRWKVPIWMSPFLSRHTNPQTHEPTIAYKDARGNEFTIPLSLAPYLLPQYQNPQQQQPLQMTIKKTDTAGNTYEIPLWLAMQTELSAPRSQNNEYTHLLSAINELRAKISELNAPSPVDFGRDAFRRIKEEKEFWQDIFAPPRTNEVLDRERIKQEEETKRERERTKQKQYDALSRIFEEQKGQEQIQMPEPETTAAEKGADLIRRIQAKAKEEALIV